MKKLKDGYNPKNFYLSPNSGLYFSKSFMEPFHDFINKEGKTKEQRAALELSLLDILLLDEEEEEEEEEDFDERIKLHERILKLLKEFTEKSLEISRKILYLCRDEEEGGVEESKESVVRGESKESVVRGESKEEEEIIVVDDEFKKDKRKYCEFLKKKNKILYNIFSRNKNLIHTIKNNNGGSRNRYR